MAEATIASVGTLLVLCAVFARQPWLDRHFLPSWFLPRPWLVAIESSVRIGLTIAGLWIVLWLRARAGRFAASSPGSRHCRSAIAIVLALTAGELVLR